MGLFSREVREREVAGQWLVGEVGLEPTKA